METPDEVLQKYKTIVVVGLSSDPYKTSHSVASYLQRNGYRIIPVNPDETEVLGEKAYPRLQDVPDPVEFVDVFRRPEYMAGVVDDAIATGAKVIYMQDGTADHAAAGKARAVGITVFENRCTMRDHSAMMWRPRSAS